jgi:iron(III) transport system ATP-binding protein
MSITEQKSIGIRIEDLNLSFGDTHVLKGVNLEIKPGEFFSFLGPSGSGKSTLLRAIAGFGPTPKGHIIVGDEDISILPPWKRNVGMVFQNYALWPHMTVWKNVAYGLEERKVAKALIAEKVIAALELVGLQELADRRPSQLSGGQQQRIALARTLVVEPKILLLDEPLSNLDANLRVQMRRDILALQKKLGITTIFVTHDQEEANTTSERMAVLNDGVVQQVGRPVDLYDKPENLFVADFLGSANLLKGSVDKKNNQFITNDNLPISLPTNNNIDGEAHLLIRPQSIEVSTIDHQGQCSDDIHLSGHITAYEFLGSVIRYGVKVSEHNLSVDVQHHCGDSVLEPNTDVVLRINKKRMYVF